MDTLFEYSNLPNVNILTHTAEVALSDEQRHSIKMLKKMHRDQDDRSNQDQEKDENPSGFSSDINQDKGDFDVPESCTKVAADFVSPENIHECLQLTEEFRLLPKNHRAREDELEVKKMILHAVNNAVSDIEKLTALENNLLWNVEHQQ